MNRRDDAETIRLQQEAERRVRAGQSRPDISRELGLPLHLLASWALKGGWRIKDIRAEQSAQERRRLPTTATTEATAPKAPEAQTPPPLLPTTTEQHSNNAAATQTTE